MGIAIKNRLQVIGRFVKVPGFEPLSEQTTSNLSISMVATSSYIDLVRALELIPGSKIVITHNGGPTAGSFGHDKFLELPSGPPPDYECPSNVIEDWYKILQDAARERSTSRSECVSICNPYQCDDFNDFCCSVRNS